MWALKAAETVAECRQTIYTHIGSTAFYFSLQNVVVGGGNWRTKVSVITLNPRDGTLCRGTEAEIWFSFPTLEFDFGQLLSSG